MPIQFKAENGGKILIVYASGKLSKADHESFVPEVDYLIQQYGILHSLFFPRISSVAFWRHAGSG